MRSRSALASSNGRSWSPRFPTSAGRPSRQESSTRNPRRAARHASDAMTCGAGAPSRPVRSRAVRPSATDDRSRTSPARTSRRIVRTMKNALGGGLAALAVSSALAQDKPPEDAVVVTATRRPQPSLEIPASIDRIYADEIRAGRPQLNLTQSLGRVPGVVVQNRQNYAQDLQISTRGFGARATFGVRGIRLIADGIPATMPDGQGQASTFALGSAERIEVLRGPFSALYGNAAGGVITVETEDAPERPTGEASLHAGSYDTWKAGLKLGGQWGA